MKKKVSLEVNSVKLWNLTVTDQTAHRKALRTRSWTTWDKDFLCGNIVLTILVLGDHNRGYSITIWIPNQAIVSPITILWCNHCSFIFWFIYLVQEGPNHSVFNGQRRVLLVVRRRGCKWRRWSHNSEHVSWQRLMLGRREEGRERGGAFGTDLSTLSGFPYLCRKDEGWADCPQQANH